MTDKKCSRVNRGINNRSMYYQYYFKNGECSKMLNLDPEGKKNGMEYLYYGFSRNTTEYQKWKNGSMAASEDFNEAAKKDDKKAGHKMRMNGGMNKNKMNMSMGNQNMSTSVNFNV